MKHLLVDDRSLNLDDTQGMFLLLGAGLLIATTSLIFERIGSCLYLFQIQKSTKLQVKKIESILDKANIQSVTIQNSYRVSNCIEYSKTDENTLDDKYASDEDFMENYFGSLK